MEAAANRIKSRVDGRIQAQADTRAESLERERVGMEAMASREGVLGAAVFELFDTIDIRNRTEHPIRHIGRWALDRLLHSKTTYHTLSMWDLGSGPVRVFKLDGKVDAQHFHFSGLPEKMDAEFMFAHSRRLDLDGPVERNGKTILGPETLSCKAYDIITELNSNEQEEELLFSVEVPLLNTPHIATLKSYTDGQLDEEKAMEDKAIYEVALSMINQASGFVRM